MVRSYSENDAYYVLTATPLDNSKGLLDEFKIIYDNQKNLIIEVSSKISEISLARNSGKAVKGAKNIYMSNVKTTYRVEEANYFLVSSKEEIGFEKMYKKETKNIEVRNYLVTTNFSNQNYTYREPQVFKDKSLINKGNSILTNYWDFSGLAATDEEQRIIAIIEKKNVKLIVLKLLFFLFCYNNIGVKCISFSVYYFKNFKSFHIKKKFDFI